MVSARPRKRCRPMTCTGATNNFLFCVVCEIAIDINLGCPQRIARTNHYGAYLLDPVDHELVFHIVRQMATELSVPIVCKIRLLPQLSDTIKFVKGLERNGCSMIVVHGRTRGKHSQH